ncbi:MAG: tetratricopeptide repeat protein [Caldimonas sp.]
MRTLLFTDVVDSTRLVEHLGDARAAEVWAAHDRHARALLVLHHGREIDRTDGFFLLFDAAPDAARFALDYHDAVATLDLAARVGLHVAPVTLRDNDAGDVERGAKRVEVEGLAKPFAARVMALAQGGQTLLTAEARAALADAPIEGYGFESHGHYRLKGIDKPVEVFELGRLGASAFLPPPDTDKAWRVVRAGELWQPLREIPNNLPAERDAFIGRGSELQRLAQRLDAGARLVTMLGVGGTGKTRLVVRYGRVWLGDWPGGIHFCDLSEARTLDGVFSAVAVALGVPLGKGDPAVQLGHAIAGRGHCLIVLDNFEQIVAHAPATLGHWLDRAAQASFVVTSRERLHLPGEEIFPIEPLDVGGEAIELFAVRAATQRPGFAIDEANRAAVAEVVRLLDGLPLAIELAAARIRVLSPAQLVERMRDRFGLLAGARGPAARQATLRAAIDWSWELLAPWEQAAFAQCSVFEGGFTLAAAETVLDLGAWPDAPSAMDSVQALVDKSLLRAGPGIGQRRYDIDEPHFGMYVSIHDYARERLADGDRDRAHQRHGLCYAAFGSDAAVEGLSRHGGVRRRQALELELDNLVAACRRAIGRQDAAVAVPTYRAAWEVIELHGPFALGSELGAQVLAIEPMPPASRALALVVRGTTLWRLGQVQDSERVLLDAIACARAAAADRVVTMALRSLGIVRNEQGHGAEALRDYAEALARYRASGNRVGEGSVLGSIGNLQCDQGLFDDARANYVEAIAIHRETGNRRDEGSVLGNLGGVHYEQGRADQAARLCEEALAIHREVGDRRSEGVVLGNVAIIYHDAGRIDEALAQHEAALAINRELGSRRHQALGLGNLGNLLRDQGRGDDALAHYRAALAISREVGDRRHAGAVLGNVADLLVQMQRVPEAHAAHAEGEALLRQVGDRLELAKLLCGRGLLDLATGDRDSAKAALDEAEAVAAAIAAGPESGLAREVAALRAALG